jgi:hypothetical protein
VSDERFGDYPTAARNARVLVLDQLTSLLVAVAASGF